MKKIIIEINTENAAFEQDQELEVDGDCRSDKQRGRTSEGQMWADIYDSLPDGDFWAAMEEQGFFPEDFND